MKELNLFERLEREFFNTWARLHPIWASSIGLHEYDHLLPEYSLHGKLLEIQQLHRFLKRFTRINPKDFPPNRVIDLKLAQYIINLKLFVGEEIRLWESAPKLSTLIGTSIFQILSRNYAPIKRRLRSLLHRLRGIPELIHRSKTRLRSPVKCFVEIELEGITRLPGFFNMLRDIARENMGYTFCAELNKNIEKILDGLDEYCDWLIIDVLPICRTDFHIGDRMFTRLLKLRGIDLELDQLIEFAQQELVVLEAKLKSVARRIRRGASVEDVREFIRSQRPDKFDEALQYVRESVQNTRQFVAETQFAPIPSNENLYVIETPSYLRHLMPFGAYSGPAKFEKMQNGYFYVTPSDTDRERLREHDYAKLANMVVHEGYPGHHLQLTWANQHPSLFRIFADAYETVEGWALYCEDRMRQLGYEDTATSEFVYLQDLIWRVIRIPIDIRLGTGKISTQEAVNCLIDSVGMDRSAAEAEIRRYVLDPGQALSYLYGKQKIQQLRKFAQRELGNQYSDLSFHEIILRAGGLPFTLLQEELAYKIRTIKR